MQRRLFFSLLVTGLLSLTLVSALGASNSEPNNGQPIERHGIKNIHTGKGNATGVSLRSKSTQGAVSPTPQVYLVFWGSQWRTTVGDPDGAAPALQSFFGSLDGSSDTWGTILSQYCEGLAKGTTACNGQGTGIQHPASSPLAGVWYDDSAPAPSKANSSAIAGEAQAAAAHFGNTTQGPNLNAQYVIASPSGTHPDGFPSTGFCGWHSSIATPYGQIAFTNLPYVPDLGPGACTTLPNAGLLDGYFSTETHEYAETVTDFWPSNGWLGAGGAEIGDLCESLDSTITLNGQTFDVQGLWSNIAGACVTSG
jgi:serine protease